MQELKKYFSISSKPSIIWAKGELLQDRLSLDSYNETYFMWREHCENNSDIEMKKIIDICDKAEIGFTAKRNYREKGVKFLNISNIKPFEIDITSVKYISKEAHLKLSKSKLIEGDVLLTITGTIGDSVVVPKSLGDANISANIVTMKPKKNYDSYYLSAFFNSAYGKLQTKGSSKSNVWSNLGLTQVREIEIPIPSPEIQKFIGDKVRRAEELREEAKRMKKETEGLIINKLGTINLEENRNYSSAFISSEKIVERIDSEYYHSKYLNIEDELNRKGFKVKKLGEVCTRIFNGRTYSTTDKERKYCNVGVGELGDWFVNKSKEKFINEKVDKKYCLKANSIIWGNAAHLAKYIGEKVNIVLEEETVIPTTEVTAIEPNEEAIDPYYLFIFMRTQWGYYQIQRTVKGMTAHSYPQDISNILVPIIDLTNEELEVLKNNVITSYKNELNAKQLIQQAKQDVEDLIEGNFEMSELNKDSSTESRC